MQNLLINILKTCILRAWDFTKPGFFALAMNSYMYEHFLTAKQRKVLTEEFKFIQIPSVIKKLKCGDIGIGGIADTKDILEIVINNLGVEKPKKVENELINNNENIDS